MFLPLIPRSDHRLLCNPDKLIDQPLIVCIMDMPIEHICQRHSLRRHPVLAFIAEYRIVGEYHPTFRILNLGIRTNPFELAAVKLLVIKEYVVVSFNKIFLQFSFIAMNSV